jgi:hypothetical protein
MTLLRLARLRMVCARTQLFLRRSPTLHPSSQFATMMAVGVSCSAGLAFIFSLSPSPSLSPPPLPLPLSRSLYSLIKKIGITPLMVLGDASGKWDATYAAWCGTMATHFKALGVHYFEVGNEVNIGNNWYFYFNFILILF